MLFFQLRDAPLTLIRVQVIISCKCKMQLQEIGGMMADFVEKLISIKEVSGWSWERLADEINRAQGGSKGITGPTLYRYAMGSSRPRNEMLRRYVLDGIRRIENPDDVENTPLISTDQQRFRADQNLEQREAYFQNLYLNTPIMMHSIGRDGRLINVSNHWLEVMGYEWHEVIGRKSIDFLTEESRQEVVEHFTPKFMEKNKSRNVPVQFVKKDGEILDLLVSANAALGKDGVADYTLAVMVDVTDHGRIRKELDMFRSLVKNAPSFILTVNRNGEILSINRTLPGLAEQEVVGTKIFDYLSEESKDKTENALEELFENGQSTTLEHQAMGPDNQFTYYESCIGPIKVDNEIVAATFISTDVGERKKSEARYRVLFEQNVSPVFRVSLDGQVLDCNDAFAKLFGYSSRVDIFNANVRAFYADPNVRARYLQALEKRGFVQNFEFQYKRADGSMGWALLNSSLTPDETGVQDVILGTLLDISEKKSLEEKLQARNAYLKALHEVTLGLMSQMEIGELLETLVNRAGGLVGTSHGFVYLAGPDGKELTVQVAVGRFREFLGRKLRIGEGLSGRVLQYGRAIVIPDYRSWPDRLPDPDYDIIHSILGVPLKSGKRITGVIALAYLDEERRFGEEEQAILTQFAELASVALENARLYERLSHALKEKENTTIALQQNLNEIFTTIQVESLQIIDHVDEPDRIKHCAQEIQAYLAKAKKALQSALDAPAKER